MENTEETKETGRESVRTRMFNTDGCQFTHGGPVPTLSHWHFSSCRHAGLQAGAAADELHVDAQYQKRRGHHLCYLKKLQVTNQINTYTNVCVCLSSSGPIEQKWKFLFYYFFLFLLRDFFFLLLIRMTILNLSFKSEKTNITANGNWGERGAEFLFFSFFVFLMINYDKLMFS